jgi:hypothetical protein
MKFKIACACVFFAFAIAATPAQTNSTTGGKCDKPDVMQQVPAGDKDGHSFIIQQGKCAPKAEVGGAKATAATFSEHDEAMGNKMKGWGMYVETYDSGDKIFYNYQTTATTKDNAMVSGTNKYQVTGGTGKMKGIKGSGTCTLKGNADSSVDYECTGAYTMPGAAPAKK